ncbi:MAG: hypothetical protein ACFBSE_18400 [Prochloraceae cyanobacterium]
MSFLTAVYSFCSSRSPLHEAQLLRTQKSEVSISWSPDRIFDRSIGDWMLPW